MKVMIALLLVVIGLLVVIIAAAIADPVPMSVYGRCQYTAKNLSRGEKEYHLAMDLCEQAPRDARDIK